MSPEQAAAEKELDGRSDIYSLGCVLYEMLAGEPPFTGATAQVVIAKRLTGPAPSVRIARASVPPAVEQAVARALATAPADRLQTGRDLARALSGGETPPSATSSGWTLGREPRRIFVLAIVGAALAVGIFVWRRTITSEPLLDTSLVAVMPFRVAGADPSLAYLSEGMIDLLAAKLTGEGGPRAADPRAVLSAWRTGGEREQDASAERRMLDVAHRLGAGRVLLGSVVSTPATLVINATLLRVPGGRNRVEATVEGSADSLAALIDRLMQQLLAKEAGEGDRLAGLTSTSLPALRGYLEGQSAYRQGRYEQAVRHFQQSLQIDSSFVLAAVGLFSAAYWTPNIELFERGKRLAWEHRARLSARDRAYVLAWTGPRYPAAPSFQENLSGWQAAIETAPDRAEPWFELGDLYYHVGSLLRVDGPRERAVSAFDRALSLDSTFSAPLAHLVEIAAIGGDTARARQLGRLYFAQDSAADGADYLRWRLALAVRDTGALRGLRARMSGISTGSLRRIVGFGQLDAVGLEDVLRAASVLRARGNTPSEARLIHFELRNLALNRGRPTEALPLIRSYAEVEPYLDAHTDLQVLDALFGDGDSAAAVRAVARLEASVRAAGADTGATRASGGHLCALALWQISHGDTSQAASAVPRLRQIGSHPELEGALDSEICAGVLDVLLAGARRDLTGAARQGLTGSLDKIGSATFGSTPIENIGRLVLSRALASSGELERALEVLRARPYHHYGATYLATGLREEARLAESAGDAAAAAAALRQYLALRSDPEPALAAEVQELRHRLAALTSESTQRR